MAKEGPTERTLKRLRKAGWSAAVVEKWNPHARVRQDLFGIVDVLAVGGGETLAIQATSDSNVRSRVVKLEDSEALPDLREAGWRIEVWGWRKRRGLWEPRIVDLS